MNRPRTRDLKCTLLSTLGLVTLILLSSSARATEPQGTCTAATMHGTYVYGYTGYTVSGSTLTRFAVAGLVVFNGNGTAHGTWTTATEGEPVEHQSTFQGRYSVNADCSATEVDTDQNGNIFHFDDFTQPGGQEISFVETDPNVVSSGTETRTQQPLPY
ncbi:MAG TPA: hypothetical protein VMA09_08195 [Candidatus Binataceae bacterium]|nr:hypothetical protein [Candidatus Binataceae bacterium]